MTKRKWNEVSPQSCGAWLGSARLGSAHLLVFHWAAAVDQLQNVLGNAAFVATAANEPPVVGPFHHLFYEHGADGSDEEGADRRAPASDAPCTCRQPHLNHVALSDAQLAAVPGREVVDDACVEGGLAGAGT